MPRGPKDERLLLKAAWIFIEKEMGIELSPEVKKALEEKDQRVMAIYLELKEKIEQEKKKVVAWKKMKPKPADAPPADFDLPPHEGGEGKEQLEGVKVKEMDSYAAAAAAPPAQKAKKPTSIAIINTRTNFKMVVDAEIFNQDPEKYHALALKEK